MNAPKTMVVASMNVSTPSGATYASAEMASCCMKMVMIVKKVRSPLSAKWKDKVLQTQLEPVCVLPDVGCLCNVPDWDTEKVPSE